MDYQPEYNPQHHSSEGEEIIEMYLDDQGIKYQREVEITGLRGDTKSVRRADFYLPWYKVYLEFLGEWNTPKGREEYHIKKDVYKNNNIPCIYIYPENLGILDFIFRRRLRNELHRYKLKWQMLHYKLWIIRKIAVYCFIFWILSSLLALIATTTTAKQDTFYAIVGITIILLLIFIRTIIAIFLKNNHNNK